MTIPIHRLFFPQRLLTKQSFYPIMNENLKLEKHTINGDVCRHAPLASIDLPENQLQLVRVGVRRRYCQVEMAGDRDEKTPFQCRWAPQL